MTRRHAPSDRWQPTAAGSAQQPSAPSSWRAPHWESLGAGEPAHNSSRTSHSKADRRVEIPSAGLSLARVSHASVPDRARCHEAHALHSGAKAGNQQVGQTVRDRGQAHLGRCFLHLDRRIERRKLRQGESCQGHACSVSLTSPSRERFSARRSTRRLIRSCWTGISGARRWALRLPRRSVVNRSMISS